MKNEAISPHAKIFIIVSVLALTLAYSVYQRREIQELTTSTTLPILRSMPEFSAKLIGKDKEVSTIEVLAESPRGMFVHFWGTWCAPCEAELPSFMRLASGLEGEGVKFLLIAVNDKEKDIKKFLKRFGELPENVTVALDTTGDAMSNFGTVKVPETYLFGSDGRNLKKFVGPQEWDHAVYLDQIKRYLSPYNSD